MSSQHQADRDRSAVYPVSADLSAILGATVCVSEDVLSRSEASEDARRHHQRKAARDQARRMLMAARAAR